MSRNSLRLRLVAAGGAAILASLALAAFGLDYLFERHVRRLAFVELSVDLDQLAAGLERGEGGAIHMAQPPTDPRYAQPLSGRYWQVETPDGVLASRSLWDATIALPDEPADGRPHEHVLPGPEGETLLVLERMVFAPGRFGEGGVRTATAIDSAELRSATRAFVRDLAPYLAVLALALILAAWLQVVVGLRPLAAVGERVAAVRSGAARRLGDAFPDEVRPLAAEVDALIEARETETRRARDRAADLAHGLKTPLQALLGEAERLRARGAVAEADGIDEVAQAMRRHIDRELARARMASAAHAVASDPAAVVLALVTVLRRTSSGGRLDWRVEASLGVEARIDADDLTEALGALLENAARHARDVVTVAVDARAESVVITINDDGPGIPEAKLAGLTARGARLDLAAPGDGLGLAIATEIAEAAGGRITLANAGRGLRVTLTVPAVPRNLTAG